MIFGLALLNYVFMSTPEKVEEDCLIILSVGTVVELLMELSVFSAAKAYEIEKSKQDLETYVSLKRLELETKKMEKWDGKFPSYYIGNLPPETLLTIPSKEGK